MATSFFGKLNPSRTQSNQRPKINIWNQRENTGPLTTSYACDSASSFQIYLMGQLAAEL